MYDHITKHGITVSSDKNSHLMKLLLEASVLAERLSEGPVYNTYFKQMDWTSCKFRDKIREEQRKRFYYILSKYTEFWWD